VADLSELYGTVRTKLVGDATLVALLSSSSAVYQETSTDVKLTAPCILMRQIGSRNQYQIDGTGKYRPGWRLRILAQSADRCRAIESRLGALLEVPLNVPAGLTGATLAIDEMRQVDSLEGAGWVTSDQGTVATLETIWNCSVRPVS
jgi:hypothetical protein